MFSHRSTASSHRRWRCEPNGLATLLPVVGDDEDSTTRYVEEQLTAGSGAQGSSHPYAGVARRAKLVRNLSGLGWLWGGGWWWVGTLVRALYYP